MINTQVGIGKSEDQNDNDNEDQQITSGDQEVAIKIRKWESTRPTPHKSRAVVKTKRLKD